MDRYDNTTGTFTVPSGGDGFYYFSTYLLVQGGEYGDFEIQVNGERMCTAVMQQHDSPNDAGQAACSAATYVTEGMKEIFSSPFSFK